MSIRTGIVGLQSVFWPNAFANCLKEISNAGLVACADMGYDPDLIKISLGRTPEEYATQHDVGLYHDPVEMIEKEGLQAVCICAKHTEIVNFVELVAPLGIDIYMAKPMAKDEGRRAEAAFRHGNKVARAKFGIRQGTGPRNPAGRVNLLRR